ncbi:MAG: PAS domain S-box protein [Candidatus Marinimicrobia bacterium]|nr:PAS domain S-box protein [Candidatus Neomarinimicrobiota bacterium]
MEIDDPRTKMILEFDVTGKLLAEAEEEEVLVISLKDITERKQAEEALLESEGRYRAIFEQAADSIVLINPETGELVEFNDRAHETLGYTRDGFKDLKIPDFEVNEPGGEVVKHIEKVMREGSDSFETKHITKDGEIRDVHISAKSISIGGRNFIQGIWRDITEQKQAEEALRESEGRLRRVVTDAPVPIMIHAEDGEVLEISKAWTTLSGYSHSDIPTIADWSEKAYGRRMEDIRAIINDVFKRDVAAGDGEYTITAKSGEERTWDFISSPLGRLPDGRRLVLSMATDITERKQAEAEITRKAEELALLNELNSAVNQGASLVELLQLLRARTTQLLEGYGPAVYLLDEQGQQLTMQSAPLDPKTTSRLEKLMGFKIPQLRIPLTYDCVTIKAFRSGGLIHLNTRETVQNFIQEYIDLPTISDKLRNLAKAVLPLIIKLLGVREILIAPLVDAGKPIGLIILSTKRHFVEADLRRFSTLATQVTMIITRKQAEEALRESEEKYRLLTETADEGIYIITAKGFEYVNPAFERTTGYSAQELLGGGLDFLDLVHPEDRKQIKKRAEYRDRGREVPSRYEFRLLRKDKEVRYLDINTVALPGKPWRVMGIYRDITEQKQAEEVWRRYAAIVNTSTDFFTLINRDYVYEAVNDAYCRAQGKSRDELVGHKVADIWGQEVFEEVIEGNLSRCFQGEKVRYEAWFGFDYPTRHCFEVTYFPYHDKKNKVTHAIVATRDITDRVRADEALKVEVSYVEMLQAVTAAANGADSFEEAVRVALEHVCRHTGWPVGHVLLPDEEQDGRLVPSDIWYLSEPKKYKTFLKVTKETTFKEGTGLPGMVLATGEPAWIKDLAKDKNFLRSGTDEDIGVRAGFAFPVKVGSEVVAVLEFFAEQPAEPDEKLLEIITHVGTEVGRALERKAAEEELQRAHDKLESRVEERTAELAESSRKYRHLFEHAHDSIFIVDVETRQIVDVNENAVRRMGYMRQELLKLKIDDLAAPQSTLDIDHKIAELRESGSVIFEHIHQRKDGSTFPVEISSRIIHIGGQPVIQSFVRDISERKEAEEHLRKLSMAVEQSPAGVMITDTDGKIEYVNSAFTAMTAYSAAEAIGRNLRILNAGRRPKSFYKDLWDTIKSGHVWQGEMCNKKKNGEIYWESAIIAPIINDQGQVTHFVAVKEDITARKAAEEERERLLAELENKNQDLQQILHISSHDLRSPLVSIKGFSGILDKAMGKLGSLITGKNSKSPAEVSQELNPLLSKEIPAALDHILASTDKMERLLSGLSRLSRLGQAGMHITELDMNELLAGITKSIEFLIKKSRVRLEISELPPSRGDAILIGQVFSNLISNAVKYLHEERRGVIRISGEKLPSSTVYVVEDNGIGIAPDYQQKVFDLFQRINPSTSVGEGLGLTITRKILDRHHGRIWVESQPGKGSRFFVELPD